MMLWNMVMVAVSFMAAGSGLRDFIRNPNWLDAIWSILFFGYGVYQLLALVGKVLQDVKVMNYV